MKKLLLLTAVSCFSITAMSQGQIDNGDFETWETVSGNDEEPTNWNSFLTASGAWSFAGSNQIEQSTDVRPGSAGSTSCRIWSKSTLGIVANGNVTVGRIEMGSTTPTSPDNYNYTVTSDGDFNQPLTDQPDSIVYWVKYTPAGSQSDLARMKATMHTDYDYRDPEDAASANEIVASAVDNFPTANGWERRAVAFDYSGPATNNAYILLTFTTNEVGGGGSAGDEVLIDDVQLIYNSDASVNENSLGNMVVSLNNSTNTISVSSEDELNGTYTIYNAVGQEVQNGELAGQMNFDKPSGMYFVHIENDGAASTFQILKH